MRSLFVWRFCGALLFTSLFVPHIALAQQVNTFNQDTRFCSGRPWIDVTCNGADPTGAVDSTAALNNTIASAITNGWPVFFPTGTYKLTSKITINYQGQAANGFEIISRSAILDGRTIPSGSVLQIDCSGGTTLSPVVCNNLRLGGDLTILANTAAYVVVLGNTDFSDRHNSAAIEHLVVQNFNSSAGSGGIQANYVTNSQLWLSATTLGGSSSVGAVALEQVQTSRLGGWGSARGASAPGLLIESGATTSNQFLDFGYDPNDATCISITSAAAVTNAWLAPLLPCNTAVSSTTAANKNSLIGPNFAGTNQGPTSTGISIIGRGSISRYSAPTAASVTLAGVDDGTIFTAANGTGSPTGFSAASLGFTLPNPAAVGAGYTVGFASDAGKAAVVTPSAGAILATGRQLTQLVVGGPPNALNFEIAILASDGANWRVEHMSQNAALLNGAQTALPARWEYPGGPGYQTTQGDNGMMISSAQTTGGLSMTLPPTTTVQQGYMIGLHAAAGKAIVLSVNGTNGGTINMLGGGTTTGATFAQADSIQVFQFDGVSNFRQILGSNVDNCPNIQAFGGKGDDTIDNTAAWNLAVTWSKCVHFPAGTYLFGSAIGYTFTSDLKSLTIRGDGADLSVLHWKVPVTTALTITLDGYQDSFHLKDFTMATGTNAVDTGILVTQGASGSYPFQSGMAPNDVTGVTFRSDEGYWNQNPATPTTHAWKQCFSDIGVSTIDFTRVSVWGPTPNGSDNWPTASGGDGFVFQNGSLGVSSNVFNFHSVNVNWANNGIHIAGPTQGYVVDGGSNFTGNRTGINSDNVSGLAQLSVTSSQFNNLFSILFNGSFADIQIANSTFFINTLGVGVQLNGLSENTAINGNVFVGNIARSNAGAGVVLNPFTDESVQPDWAPAIITGNAFDRLIYGVVMHPNSAGAIVQANMFNTTLFNVANTSSNIQTTVTGATQTHLPAYGFVTNAVDNGSGRVRVTISDTSPFFNGQMVLAGGIGGLAGLTAGEFLISPVMVMDSTHLDLVTLTFSGTYTSGGTITSLP